MKNQKWISVAEQLPELEKEVLLYNHYVSSSGKDFSIKFVGYLNSYTTRKSNDTITVNCEWTCIALNSTNSFDNVLHWMELPEDPQI